MLKNSRIYGTLLFAFYLIYQEKPIDISLSPFLTFPILKQFNAQFVQFVTSLINCHKLCIRLLVDLNKHDLITVLCKNLESIVQDCNVQSRNLIKFCVKQNMIYNRIPLDQE